MRARGKIERGKRVRARKRKREEGVDPNIRGLYTVNEVPSM